MNKSISLEDMDDRDLADLLAQELRRKGHSADLRGARLNVYWMDTDSAFRPQSWNIVFALDRIEELLFSPEADGTAYGEYVIY